MAVKNLTKMIIITDIEKVTGPKFGYNVTTNESDEPIFIDLHDLAEVNENYFMFFKDHAYYYNEVKQVLYDAYNEGVINLNVN